MRRATQSAAKTKKAAGLCGGRSEVRCLQIPFLLRNKEMQEKWDRPPGGHVVFSNVVTNHGSAYNPTSGNFTCPDDDYYLFSWSGTCMWGCDLDLHIGESTETYIKRSYIGRRPDSADGTGTSGTSSMSTVVKCSTGSNVWLRLTQTSTSNPILAHYTSFSGYRIPGQG